VKLGFLASHRGSGVQAVVEACASGRLAAAPRVVISNNADAEVLARARRYGIPSCHLSGSTHPDPVRLDEAILRVLNIHPALLPKFGGQGMYGRRVHETVLAAGERETGVTIHLADDEFDHGRIVAQCRVPVVPGDTVESLAARVLDLEHAFLVETLAAIVSGAVKLP
jgi:phosphoribosylglycinamide formyltransferase-1